METSTQTALVLAAQAGDQLAFETLVEPYQRELFVHRYRMLSSFHNAEDLVQETRLARMGETCDPHESRIVPSLIVPHRHQSVPQSASEHSSTVLAIRHASQERSQQPSAGTSAGADLAGTVP